MKDNITYGVIGLLLGIILTWVVAVSAVNNQNAGMMRMMGMRNMMGGSNMMGNFDDHHDDDFGMMGGQDMSGVMKSMMSGLENKTGDEFDKAFLSEMIVHHQGAIDIADLALHNAQHQEIKDLANNIISAQIKEVKQMEAWQQAWYK